MRCHYDVLGVAHAMTAGQLAALPIVHLSDSGDAAGETTDTDG